MFRTFKFSKKQLNKVNYIVFAISVVLPLSIFALSFRDNLTYDQSMLMPVILISLLISMVLFYEGKKMVGKLRDNKIEVTEERMLRFNEDKSELIFFEDISSVRAHRGLNGKIDKIKIRTNYNETVFENFDDMEELLEIIEQKTEVKTIRTGTKQIYNSLAMIAVLTFGVYFMFKM